MGEIHEEIRIALRKSNSHGLRGPRGVRALHSQPSNWHKENKIILPVLKKCFRIRQRGLFFQEEQEPRKDGERAHGRGETRG